MTSIYFYSTFQNLKVQGNKLPGGLMCKNLYVQNKDFSDFCVIYA